MNWYKVFYLMTVAERLQTFFLVFAIISTVIGGVAFITFVANKIGYLAGDGENKKHILHARKWIFMMWPIMILFWAAWVATPNKKDMVLIVAGGAVGQFVMNDSSARKLPADVTQLLRAKILEETKNLNWELFPQVDTLKNKSKEELLKIIKDMKK